MIAEFERREEGLAHAGEHRHDFQHGLGGVEGWKNHDELVSPQTRDSVGFPYGAGKALRDRLQQMVAGVVPHRVVDALEVVEIQEKTCDLVAIARSLGDDLFEPLIEKCAVRQPGEDVVLRELERLRSRDLELLGPLRNLFFERALVATYLRLRLREPLRHMIEGVGEQPQLVVRSRGHVDVELARADSARRAHELADRSYQPAGQQQREYDGNDHQRADHRQRSEQIALQLALAAVESHSQPHVTDDRPLRRRRRLPGHPRGEHGQGNVEIPPAGVLLFSGNHVAVSRQGIRTRRESGVAV